MKTYKFEAVIKKVEGVDSGYVEFPYDVEKEFGVKGQVKVKATFDGFEYRGSLVKMGSDCHWIGLNKQVRTAIGKGVGDTIKVSIEKDVEERIVKVPEDLMKLLKQFPEELAFFNSLAFSHRKEYVQWINSAKKEETRAARLEKMIGMLAKKKKNLSA